MTIFLRITLKKYLIVNIVVYSRYLMYSVHSPSVNSFHYIFSKNLLSFNIIGFRYLKVLFRQTIYENQKENKNWCSLVLEFQGTNKNLDLLTISIKFILLEWRGLVNYFLSTKRIISICIYYIYNIFLHSFLSLPLPSSWLLSISCFLDKLCCTDIFPCILKFPWRENPKLNFLEK